MILGSSLHYPRQVRIEIASVRIQVTERVIIIRYNCSSLRLQEMHMYRGKIFITMQKNNIH